jgi:error-prone DNA polymerase
MGKDDIEELKFMKVDVLGVGMMGCMRRAFDLLAEHKGFELAVARRCRRRSDRLRHDRSADTLGTFQIESRAQMSMLPR